MTELPPTVSFPSISTKMTNKAKASIGLGSLYTEVAWYAEPVRQNLGIDPNNQAHDLLS